MRGMRNQLASLHYCVRVSLGPCPRLRCWAAQNFARCALQSALVNTVPPARLKFLPRVCAHTQSPEKLWASLSTNLLLKVSWLALCSAPRTALTSVKLGICRTLGGLPHVRQLHAGLAWRSRPRCLRRPRPPASGSRQTAATTARAIAAIHGIAPPSALAPTRAHGGGSVASARGVGMCQA